MQYQLPPHGFWIKQTGGMSVLDVFMLVVVLLLNLMWFCVGMKNFNDEHAASEMGSGRWVEAHDPVENTLTAWVPLPTLASCLPLSPNPPPTVSAAGIKTVEEVWQLRLEW